MKGVVFSWFFPPETSAEGLVTYKLLKSSRYEYDVYASNKAIWGYTVKSNLTSKNIHSYLFNASNFDDWKAMCTNLYSIKSNEYNFMMSRSMPPESHEIALRIKKERPDLCWLASFGDPISFNPYEITNVVNGKSFIPGRIKKLMLDYPRTWINCLNNMGLYSNNVLMRMIKLEKQFFEKADLLIFPNLKQCIYSLDKDYNKYKEKSIILPHSFDTDMIQKEKDIIKNKNGRYTFLYSGYLDLHRNPEPIILAYEAIKTASPEIAERMLIIFVGNMPQRFKNMIQIKGLYENIVVHEPVDYFTSLKMMNDADCLIHIDAKFEYKYDSNIFFASKLADYMGNYKPILGITAKDSPAYEILKKSNNKVHEREDISGISKSMIEFFSQRCNVDYTYYDTYNSKTVAALYDEKISELIKQ